MALFFFSIFNYSLHIVHFTLLVCSASSFDKCIELCNPTMTKWFNRIAALL